MDITDTAMEAGGREAGGLLPHIKYSQPFIDSQVTLYTPHGWGNPKLGTRTRNSGGNPKIGKWRYYQVQAQWELPPTNREMGTPDRGKPDAPVPFI